MKKRMLLTVLSALTVLMLISSIVVKSYASLTDDKSDVQNKINEAKNALNDISDDKDEAETEIAKNYHTSYRSTKAIRYISSTNR